MTRRAFSKSAVGLCIGLAACGDTSLEWTEQVQLQSGEVILLRRSAVFRENWVPGGGGGAFNKGATVEVAGPAKSGWPGKWSGRLVPILFDRDQATNEWALVATFFHCDSWYELGRPSLPYAEFRFRGGQWIQKSLTPQWIGRDANVLVADLLVARSANKRELSLREKSGFLSDPVISPEYKKIVAKWSSGC